MNVLNVILCLFTTHTKMMVAIDRMIPRMAVTSVPVRVDAQQQHFCNRFIASGQCYFKSQHSLDIVLPPHDCNKNI